MMARAFALARAESSIQPLQGRTTKIKRKEVKENEKGIEQGTTLLFGDSEQE